ncbi:hypothetical protein HN748_06420 [Candidatus Peregrinibacteria bacterium]|jgi:hypothetical protein|nr:hypothetical protein [Candidatus Peregrinibacteria bacterium]MBT7483143.1 hypothetical protein [Candidatus Peregrinibacteria bacterium]MBT7703837.1 hypothetical protein [Candidatus Peregrinibacteria bacterium]
MRALYLIGSVMSFVIILILAFENIQASCNYLTFFFWEISSGVAPTFVLFGSAIVGMVAGSFMTLLASSFLAESDDDEDDIDFEV